jgi:hypothetical protein
MARIIGLADRNRIAAQDGVEGTTAIDLRSGRA